MTSKPYSERTAIVSPLTDLLKSKRFLVSIAGTIAAVIVVLVPSLDAVRGQLLTLITVAVAVLVGGYTVNDAVETGTGAIDAVPADTTSNVKALAHEALATLLPDTIEQPAIALSDAVIDQIASAVAAKLAEPKVVNVAIKATIPDVPPSGSNSG